MDRLSGKGCQVIRVEADAVDAADAATRPEQVRLAVIIDEDLGVEASVPAFLDGPRILEQAQVCIRPERMVRDEYVVGVAGQVETPLVFDEVRRHGDMLHSMEFPVQQVVGNPHAAAGAAHVVLAAFLDDGHVARGVAALPDRHGEGIAVTLSIRRHAVAQGQQRGYQCTVFHHEVKVVNRRPNTNS